MSLKGPLKVFDEVVVSQAYLVVDSVHVEKGGYASCHVSTYARPPKPVTLTRKTLDTKTGNLVDESYSDTDRGQVIEHFSVAGVMVNGKDPFVAAYEQIKTLCGDRLKDLVDA